MTSSFRGQAVRLVTGTPVERLARLTWRGIFRRVPDGWLSSAERKGRDYDRMTVEIARRTLRRDSNSIDAGAHLGELLTEFVALAPDGSHIAVEPLPRFARWLAKRFAGVRVENVALGAEEGWATFVVEADAARSHLTGPGDGRPDDGERLTVSVLTLDSLVAADHRVDFIKLDVEGAERDVILGARKTLSRHGPVVVFECTSGHVELVMDAFANVPHRDYRVDLLPDYLAGGKPPARGDLVSRAQRDGEYYYVAASP